MDGRLSGRQQGRRLVLGLSVEVTDILEGPRTRARALLTPVHVEPLSSLRGPRFPGLWGRVGSFDSESPGRGRRARLGVSGP